MNIPEYYKQFQKQPEKKEEETKKPEQKETPPRPEQKQQSQVNREPAQIKDKTIPYSANTFSLSLLEEWQDKTIYTLTGPVTDGIQHNVIINVDKEVEFDTLEQYADWQIKTLEQELKGCTLLKRGQTKLTNGTEAHEAIFKWYPVEDICIYQHQIFVLVNKVAYKMTASFTKKTRQTIGPSVLRMMLSLNLVKK